MSPPAHALSVPPCTLGHIVDARESSNPPQAIAYASDADWFKAELHPLERSLRAYFRMKFPHIDDPDDLIQETYFRILKARAANRTLMSKAYFFTVARNLGYDLCRRRAFVQIDPIGDLNDLSVVDTEANAADSAANDNERSLLAAAIAALPERCREVVTRRKLGGLSHRQIGEALGISEKTSMAHMNLGMAKLREFLVQHGVELGRRL